VYFTPEEDSNVEKKRMVREFKQMLGGYLFDGAMLYTPHKYEEDVSLDYSVVGVAVCTNMNKGMILLR
jgi:hypothetical protein